MRFALGVVVLVLATLTSRPALGQFIDPDQLTRVASVGVDIALTVDEGHIDCRPDTRALATEAELVLRRSGIRTIDLDREQVWGTHRLTVSIVGLPSTIGRVTYGCAFAAQFSLTRMEALMDLAAETPTAAFASPSIGLVVAFDASYVVTTGRGSTAATDTLVTAANRGTSALANEILKARQGR